MRTGPRSRTARIASAAACALVLAPALARAQPRSEDEAPVDGAPDEEAPEPGSEDAWRWPGTAVWDLQLRVAIPSQSAFDRALAAHGHADGSVAPALVTGVAFPVAVEWLWIGGQLGVRGRAWDHPTREDASLLAVDLLAVVHARFLIGNRVELGVGVGGGLGWMGVRVNGVMNDQFVPRFDVHAALAIQADRHLAFGPRIGWDYFQGSGVNQYGHSVEVGGPYFVLGIEGRT